MTLLGIKNFQGKDRDLLKKCLGWAFVVLIGLSLPADKKIRYILPVAPALALICGYLFFTTAEKETILKVAREHLGRSRLGPQIRRSLEDAIEKLASRKLIVAEDSELFATEESRTANFSTYTSYRSRTRYTGRYRRRYSAHRR